MKILRPISILVSCLMWTASAAAQISLTPPGAQSPPATSKPRKAEGKTRNAKKPAAPAVTPARGNAEARGNPHAGRDRDARAGA